MKTTVAIKKIMFHFPLSDEVLQSIAITKKLFLEREEAILSYN